jgi:hypothetical protein
MATMSVAFPWLHHEIAQWSTSTEICFHAWQRRWGWANLHYHNEFNVFIVGNCIEFFDRMLFSIEITTRSRFQIRGMLRIV